MAGRSREASTARQELSRREKRALRILDAAASLILRWGYDKTTLDDIAREAGVSKSSIYLHWRTREELFSALIKRERAEQGEEVLRCIAADPEGTTLRGMFKYTALTMMKRPLIKALMLRDMDVVGKYARSRQSDAAHIERLEGFKSYLALLRKQGRIGTDLSLEAQVYMLSAIFTGFFLVSPFMPDEFAFSDEEIAELIAETIHRALETNHAIPADTLQTTSHTFLQYLKHAIDAAQKEFQQELHAEHSSGEKRNHHEQ